MSILTQIRLASLAHKCLNSDVRDGSRYFFKNGLRTKPTLQSTNFACSVGFSPLIEPKICYNYSNQHTPIPYQFEKKTFKSLVINPINIYGSHISLLNRCNYPNDTTETDRVLQTSSNHYHENRYDDNNFKKRRWSDWGWKRRRNIVTLGLFGLFTQMTNGEVVVEPGDQEKYNKLSPIEKLTARGVWAMCNEEYDKAEEFFHQALGLAQEEKNEEQEVLLLNCLAASYMESGDYSRAEQLYIDLIRRMIANETSETDPVVLELSLKLASIYSKNKKTHEKALKGFKFIIESLRNNLYDLFTNIEDLNVNELSEDKRNQLALLGWSYDWFAKLLIAMNDYNAAVDILQKALQISYKVLGPLHDQTLILLNDLGTTLAMNNAAEKGQEFLKRAVEGAIESKSEELASFYVNLGLVNLKLNQSKEAARYCEYSMELALKNLEHHNSKEVLKLSKNCLDQTNRLDGGTD